MTFIRGRGKAQKNDRKERERRRRGRIISFRNSTYNKYSRAYLPTIPRMI